MTSPDSPMHSCDLLGIVAPAAANAAGTTTLRVPSTAGPPAHRWQSHPARADDPGAVDGVLGGPHRMRQEDQAGRPDGGRPPAEHDSGHPAPGVHALLGHVVQEPPAGRREHAKHGDPDPAGRTPLLAQCQVGWQCPATARTSAVVSTTIHPGPDRSAAGRGPRQGVSQVPSSGRPRLHRLLPDKNPSPCYLWSTVVRPRFRALLLLPADRTPAHGGTRRSDNLS